MRHMVGTHRLPQAFNDFQPHLLTPGFLMPTCSLSQPRKWPTNAKRIRHPRLALTLAHSSLPLLVSNTSYITSPSHACLFGHPGCTSTVPISFISFSCLNRSKIGSVFADILRRTSFAMMHIVPAATYRQELCCRLTVSAFARGLQ